MKAPGAKASIDLSLTGSHVPAEVAHSFLRWGNPRKIPGFQDLVFVPQPLRLPTHPREVQTAVRLGASSAARPLELAMPIILAVGESWLLSKPARMALAQASRLAGTAVHTFDVSAEERQAADQIVLQVFVNNLPMPDHDLRQAQALELNFHQEAGMNGCLAAHQLHPPISPLPPGQAALLPEDDLAGSIRKYRQATNHQIPITLSLGMGRVSQDIRFALKVKADVVRMTGLTDAPGCRPEKVSAPLGIPTIGGLAAARRTLAEHGLENRLDLVVDGGIRNGADVAKALALGAKAVTVGRGAWLALGCTGCMACRRGSCPQGIATRDPNLMKKLDIDAGARRVYDYLTTLQEEVQQICAVLGKSDVAELGVEDVQALTMEASAMTGLPLVGTGKVF